MITFFKVYKQRKIRFVQHKESRLIDSVHKITNIKPDVTLSAKWNFHFLLLIVATTIIMND